MLFHSIYVAYLLASLHQLGLQLNQLLLHDVHISLSSQQLLQTNLS